MSYETFLREKLPRHQPSGFEPAAIHEILYPFQAAITRWATRMGCAAVFADCGLGKTFIQLEWARLVQERAGRPVLIVAPLCVVAQTIEEASRIGLDVRRVVKPSEDALQITNYERLKAFLDADYGGLVLDESSILKSIDGKTRTLILTAFGGIPYRLACTATPSPNDISEIGNHAQFCGVLSRAEMLATYFVHIDGQHWRLKSHAQGAFWAWLASWSVFVRAPSDIGFEDDGYVLPPLSIEQEVVHASLGEPEPGMILALPKPGIQGRRQARKASLSERVSAAAARIKREPDEQWLVWCGLNAEGRELKAKLGEACVLVEGADKPADKIKREARWRAGDVRVLISKPSIFGFGMNWQHCARVIFLGLGDSYEQYYQAIRRTWRFGQERRVHCYIIVSDLETEVLANVKRKQKQATEMAAKVIAGMGDIEKRAVRGKAPPAVPYETRQESSRDWVLRQGDCIERIGEIADGTVGLSVFSPPFAALYTYTASPRDLGNCRGYDAFFEHYRMLLPELLRVTMPGRRCCTHVQQIAMKKVTDGVIGWRDFRADVVREMVQAGWIYDGEVVIDKCPQAQAIRTHSKALLFAQLHKDSSWCRPAMADYILLFRAPGENPEAVKPDVNNEEWIQWAHPVWYGIRESDTLKVAEARDEKDERHICPLQLGTIERCVRLWSNPGDVVFSPFAGIGSEGFVALKHGRRFEGIELKRSYYEVAARNLRRGAALADELPLLTMVQTG